MSAIIVAIFELSGRKGEGLVLLYRNFLFKQMYSNDKQHIFPMEITHIFTTDAKGLNKIHFVEHGAKK